MKKVFKFFREWYYRLSGPTPKFFRKLRRAGVTLISLGTGLTAPNLANVPHIPEMLGTIGGYLFAMGTVIVLVCSSVVDNHDDLVEKMDENKPDNTN